MDVTTCISDPDVRPTVVSSVRNPVIVLRGPVYVIEFRLSSEREPAEKNFWSESEASEADPDKQSIALSPRDNIRRFAPRRLARTWRRRFLAWSTTHQAATGTQRLSLGNDTLITRIHVSMASYSGVINSAGVVVRNEGCLARNSGHRTRGINLGLRFEWWHKDHKSRSIACADAGSTLDRSNSPSQWVNESRND